MEREFKFVNEIKRKRMRLLNNKKKVQNQLNK